MFSFLSLLVEAGTHIGLTLYAGVEAVCLCYLCNNKKESPSH